MTRQIWVWSDPHFNHANIIWYCDRPFKDVPHMNEALIENWNAKVKPDDIGYMLGDIYCGNKGSINSILHRLNGKKRLILGNHDTPEDGILRHHFQKIMMWRLFKDEKVLLTHVPIHPASLTEKYDLRNVHGHIHEKSLNDPRYINVSVEHTDYAPVALEDLYGFRSKRIVTETIPIQDTSASP